MVAVPRNRPSARSGSVGALFCNEKQGAHGNVRYAAQRTIMADEQATGTPSFNNHFSMQCLMLVLGRGRNDRVSAGIVIHGLRYWQSIAPCVEWRYKIGTTRGHSADQNARGKMSPLICSFYNLNACPPLPTSPLPTPYVGLRSILLPRAPQAGRLNGSQLGIAHVHLGRCAVRRRADPIYRSSAASVRRKNLSMSSTIGVNQGS